MTPTQAHHIDEMERDMQDEGGSDEALSADDLERKNQRCLYVEHGYLCLRDGTGWLLKDINLTACGTEDIMPQFAEHLASLTERSPQ